MPGSDVSAPGVEHELSPLDRPLDGGLLHPKLGLGSAAHRHPTEETPALAALVGVAEDLHAPGHFVTRLQDQVLEVELHTRVQAQEHAAP